MNAQVYIDIGQGIHYREKKSSMKWKRNKTTWVYFVFQKYSKFWSISLEHFIKNKPHISEECIGQSVEQFKIWNYKFFFLYRKICLTLMVTGSSSGKHAWRNIFLAHDCDINLKKTPNNYWTKYIFLTDKKEGYIHAILSCHDR